MIALVTLVAGAVAVVLALRSPDGLRSVTNVGSLVAALAPLVLGLVMWVRRPAPVALGTSTHEQTDAARRHLASQVLSQWRAELNVRQLDDPGALAVRWQCTQLDVVDHAVHVDRDRRRTRFHGRTDRIGELAGEFRELKRRRLVILGEPGMGKTTLALLLLRELLEHAEPDDPVPILLSMSDWDPGAESLPEWLARRLTEDYPALRATVFGPDAARALVTQRKILPILDGLDELPDEVQPAILVRLNENAADPLVLTCRTAEYQDAVTAPGGDALTGGAVIEPNPLTGTDAATYLAGCLPPGTRGTWHHLLATLRRDPGSPISKALSTPLALWLLRTVYVETRTHPAELCDTTLFPTADAIVEHLLDHLVVAAVAANPPHPDDDEHPFRPRRAWDPAEATRWLAFLAGHLNTLGTRDLAWWQLHRAASPRVAAGFVAGLTMALTTGIAEGVGWGIAQGLLVGPVLGLVFGLVVAFARGLTVGHVLALDFASNLVGGWASAVVNGELVLGLVLAVMAAIPIVLVAVHAARRTPVDRPAYADLRLRGRTRLLSRKLVGRAGDGLVLRFVPGFAVGLVLGGIFALENKVSNGLQSGLLFGVMLGLASWLTIGVTEWAEAPITDERPRTPAATFLRDLRLLFIKLLTGGVALGVATGTQDILIGGNGLTKGLSIAVFVAVSIAVGVGLHQPGGRYLVTVAVLHARRRIPLRLIRFLDDAHRLGILRQHGPVYQFRHAKLQDRLARVT